MLRKAIFGAIFFSMAIIASRAADSTRPTPGDDWLLPPNVAFERDENASEAEADSIDLTLAAVEAVGRIVRVDGSEIATENCRDGKNARFELRPGGAFLLNPPVDPSVAARFCREISNRDELCDRIWLRNGDEFSGALLSVDRRRVIFRAFEIDVSIPRGLVRAVRFADAAEK